MQANLFETNKHRQNSYPQIKFAWLRVHSMAFLASSVKGFYNNPMIIACPFCKTRFLVAASLFAAGPRVIRCAKCKHSWQADGGEQAGADGITVKETDHNESEQIVSQSPAPQTYQPLFSPAIIKIAKTGVLVLCGLFLVWFVLNRENIVRKISFLEPFYDALGLHIFHTGEGLNIRNVRSELVYQDGIMKLMVEGKILNISKKTQEIPPLKASAIGPDGQTMQDWQIDPPTAKVSAGEEVPFHSSINAPRGTVVDILLNFIETRPHDSSLPEHHK